MSTGSFFEFREKIVTAGRRKGGSGPAPAADGKAAAMTVSQLTGLIDKSIRAGVPAHVYVKGEVSNFNHHRSSGHLYFTMKDESACIDCVMFKSDMARLKFQPTDGMEMLAGGRVAVYPQRGKYQFYATTLQPLGAGALELAFQQMRAKLEKEGFFAQERKKPIPPYPSRIVMITSRQTAALQDMLKVLRRFPWLKLFVYHVPVQGDGCGERIADAIAHLSARAQSLNADVILLARGGGSLEDLWGFNLEVVARAISRCSIPIVTGIGHEVDTSIADLVADHHAHTPTEAAQVITANWRVAGESLDSDAHRLRRSVGNALRHARQQLANIERHEAFRRPMDCVNTRRQLLDDRQRVLIGAMGGRVRSLHRRVADIEAKLEAHKPVNVVARMRQKLADGEKRIVEVIGARLRHHHKRISMFTAMLRERHPRHQVKLGAARVDSIQSRLHRVMECEMDRHRLKIDGLSAHLNAIGPEQVLKRGYSMTIRKKDGSVVRSAQQVKAGERLVTRLADGKIESIAEDPVQLPLFE